MNGEDRERVRRFVERLDRRRAVLADELADELAPVRDLSLEERGAWVASACRGAWAVLRSRGDFEQMVQRHEPPAPDLPEIWSRLMDRRRSAAQRAER